MGLCVTCPTCVLEARALNPSVFEKVLLSYDKPTLFQQGTVLLNLLETNTKLP